LDANWCPDSWRIDRGTGSRKDVRDLVEKDDLKGAEMIREFQHRVHPQHYRLTVKLPKESAV